jgi:hypothetical protein
MPSFEKRAPGTKREEDEEDEKEDDEKEDDEDEGYSV